MDIIHKSQPLVDEYFHDVYTQDLSLEQVPWCTGAVGIELQKRLIDKTILPGMTIFDVGCGIGTESVFLSQNGLKVFGLDKDKNAINIAKKYAKLLNTKPTFILGDILNPEFKKPPLKKQLHLIDVITDQGCFHHILPQDRHKYAKNILSLLKPEGRFLLRGFSTEMPPSNSGKGPIRLSKQDILGTFEKYFVTEKLFIFDNIPVPTTPEKPQRFWFYQGKAKQ